MAFKTTDRSTSLSITHLNHPAQLLLRSSLSQSARRLYKRSWQLYFTFNPYCRELPLSVLDICNFIGFLFDRSYSPSTILSNISAISFMHKIFGFADPTTSFIVNKLIKGCQKLRKSKDTRRPITLEILQKLVLAMENCIPALSHRVLLKAVFLLAFNAFLRLGEILIRSEQDIPKVLQANDVEVQFSNGAPVSLTLVLRHFKNIRNNFPVTISLEANKQDKLLCPVLALQHYLDVNKTGQGPLFQFPGGSPVTHAFVSKNLSKILDFIGLDTRTYKGHSFRIGAATHAAKLGLSESYIKQLGRWNSNAVQRYIRISSFQL